MSTRPDCDQIRELAPELALGIASGEERGRALEHLAACPQCRALVQELSDASDELLLAAPALEPPVGFESRVLERFPKRQRFKPKLALALAAAAVLLLAGAGGTYLALRPDLRFAHHYHDVFASAQGQYFAANPVYAGNKELGQAFAYQGSPSWVYFVLDSSSAGHRYSVQLVTRGGRQMNLGKFLPTSGNTSWGCTLPVSLRSVSRLRLIPDHGDTLEAEFHAE